MTEASEVPKGGGETGPDRVSRAATASNFGLVLVELDESLVTETNDAIEDLVSEVIEGKTPHQNSIVAKWRPDGKSNQFNAIKFRCDD